MTRENHMVTSVVLRTCNRFPSVLAPAMVGRIIVETELLMAEGKEMTGRAIPVKIP